VVGSNDHLTAKGGLTPFVNRWNGELRRQRDDLISSAVEERACAKEPSDALLRDGCEGHVYLAFGAGLQNEDLSSENAGRGIHFGNHLLGKREVRVHQMGDDLGRWHHFVEQCEALRR
jgi:hypothetical protein